MNKPGAAGPRRARRPPCRPERATPSAGGSALIVHHGVVPKLVNLRRIGFRNDLYRLTLTSLWIGDGPAAAVMGSVPIRRGGMLPKLVNF